jgi:hypothetical protein
MPRVNHLSAKPIPSMTRQRLQDRKQQQRGGFCIMVEVGERDVQGLVVDGVLARDSGQPVPWVRF